jgi:hypothetical protein
MGAAVPGITPSVCRVGKDMKTLNKKNDFMLSTNYKLLRKVNIQ